MPTAPLTPCAHPRCAGLAPRGARYCAAHAPTAAQVQAREAAAADARRGHAAARGYGSKWRSQALAFRSRFPLCHGVLVATSVWSEASAREFHALRLREAEAGRFAGFLADRGPGADWLRRYPIYAYRALPVASASAVVDHIRPHRGDPHLLWSEWNWQALSKHAHDVKTARHDGGFRGGAQSGPGPVPAEGWL